MPNMPTAIPIEPTRNPASMQGRGTGIEHIDEHGELWAELIATATALGLVGSGGDLATRVRDLERSRRGKRCCEALMLAHGAPTPELESLVSTWLEGDQIGRAHV